MLNEVQIKQYLQRIGYDSMLSADLSTLFGLQWAHITHIPYENLDILAGIPLSIKVEDLFHKIVTEKSGGYCFELQGLYGELLKSCGFQCNEIQTDDICEYRFQRDSFYGWVLCQKKRGKGWKTMYGFTEEPQTDNDFVMSSFYCEKHPDSTFNKFMKISIFSGESNFTLVNAIFREYRNAKVQLQKKLTNSAEISDILKIYFGLDGYKKG